METDTPTTLQKRVRRRMDELGINPLETARRAGLGESFVRDILRGKTRSPKADNLAKLARALEVDPEYLWNPEVPASVAVSEADVAGLPVVSIVNAGAWLEVTLMDGHHEQDPIPAAPHPRFRHAKQYALLVVGDSMDKLYPDGTYVTCVDFWDAGVAIRDGLRVHVERRTGGGQLIEITIKEVGTVDGKRMLLPRSTNPKWQPVPIESTEDVEVIIKGIVTGSWRPENF